MFQRLFSGFYVRAACGPGLVLAAALIGLGMAPFGARAEAPGCNPADACCSQCDPAATRDGLCTNEIPLQDFENQSTTRAAWLMELAEPGCSALVGLTEGTCSDGKAWIQRRDAANAGETRFFDSEGAFRGMTTATDAPVPVCGAASYYPGAIVCPDPILTEVHCDGAFSSPLPPLVIGESFPLLGIFSQLPIAQFTHRLTEIGYDLDANGILDARRDFTYDSTGRLVSINYVYIGDETPDLYANNVSPFTNSLEYDPSGLLTRDTRTIFFPDQMNPILSEISYLFSGNGFDRVEFSSTSAFFFSGIFDFFYSNGLINFIQGPPGAQFFYGSNGLPEIAFLEDSLPHELTWTPGGNIETISSFNAEGLASAFGDFVYNDFSGQLEQETWVGSSSILQPFSDSLIDGDYRKTNEYYGHIRTTERIDLGNDGSDDAVLTMEWTQGLCNPVFGWFPEMGRPNFARVQGVPEVYVPGTGVEYLENCGPFPVPEPSFTISLLSGIGVICMGMAGCRARRSS